MNLLITGGCGFLGSNLAAHGIRNGHKVTVIDNLSRLGSNANLEWLKSLGDFRFIHGDTRNKEDVERVISSEHFDAIFQLAGQVAMTTSIEYPYKDFQTNVMGTIHVLEGVRKYSPETTVIFSSTNKVYGDLEQYHYTENEKRYVCNEYPNGFDENVPLDFHSPYGCSKGAADQYMIDYHRIFGLKTIVFRHSSMYGGRQFSTYDQGWIGWFCRKALELKKDSDSAPFTISGNGKQVRDVLYADDMVALYYSAAVNSDIMAGKAYNIGGGIKQSLSLLELFDMLNNKLEIQMRYERLAPRISDQKVFVADISKVKNDIGWEPKVSAAEGIDRMLGWEKDSIC